VTLEGENAFAVTAPSQGKVYFKADAVNAGTSVTFAVFVPKDNTTLQGYGEFAIRYKAPGGNGYIDFNTGKGSLTVGEWVTYTVTPADYGTGFTEFAFIIPAGNTVYFKDIEIQ
jgi:hypothetical protein